MPTAARGPLRLSTETAVAIANIHQNASDARIAAFVETAAPQFVDVLEPGEYKGFLALARQSGSDIGLRSERAFGYWALLSVMSGGAIVSDPRFQNAVRDDETGPDAAVEQLVTDLSLLPPETAEGML